MRDDDHGAAKIAHSVQHFSFGLGVEDRVGNVGVSAPTADRQTQAAPVLESGIAT